MTENELKQQQEVLDQIESAFDRGRWMVCVASIDESGKLHVNKVTLKFPLGRLMEASSLFESMCEKDLAESGFLKQNLEPLPVAKLGLEEEGGDE